MVFLVGLRFLYVQLLTLLNMEQSKYILLKQSIVCSTWLHTTERLCCDVNDYYIKPVNKYTTTIQRLKSTDLLLQQCLLFLDKQLQKIVNSCSRACYITPPPVKR